MGGVLLAITTLVPWMSLTVHVSITRSSTSNPYTITPPGSSSVSVMMFSFTKGWILVPIVVLGAGLVGGGAALAGPLRRVGVYGAVMALVVLVAEGIAYYHLHSAGSSASFLNGAGTVTSNSSVSLTPAVGGWITIVAIVALLTWAVVSGSSRRMSLSGSKAPATELPDQGTEPGGGAATPGGRRPAAAADSRPVKTGSTVPSRPTIAPFLSDPARSAPE